MPSTGCAVHGCQAGSNDPAGASTRLAGPVRSLQRIARVQLGIVVQRYGESITGGAEYHARRVAQHLAAAGHQVTVLTSTSRDARRWDNAFPPGASRDGDVRVMRFAVRSRLLRELARGMETARALVGASPVTFRQLWTIWANPYVPGLVSHLARGPRYDAVFFFTYFYYPSLAGALVAPTYRIGVPLGHDDPDFSTPMVRRMLRAFDAILTNTEEERDLVQRVLQGSPPMPASWRAPPIVVAGCGVDPPPAVIPPRPIAAPYVVYLGRMKPGTELLREGWAAFRSRYGTETFPCDGPRTARGNEIVLATIGDGELATIAGDGWKVVGHVPSAERWAWCAHAELLVNPSLYESLSLTLLEAWWVSRPVAVREQCEVMANQVARARGGVTFSEAGSFADEIARLLRDPVLRRDAGESGRSFATTRYAWPAVMAHYKAVLAGVSCVKPIPRS